MYSKETCMAAIQKIKNDNNLQWKEMAVLFNYKSANALINIAHGDKIISQKTFEKHFGPIERYMTDDLVPVAKVEEKIEEKVEQPVVTRIKKKGGIVLTAGSLSELQQLLTGIGWHIEFIPV